MESKWLELFNAKELMVDLIGNIVKTLGSYRAENLGDKMFSLYTKPSYFPELLTPIPCILQGGRGTGKTTVLKTMSYHGQYKLASGNLQLFHKVEYIGIYYKLETGLVNSFWGANRDYEFWQKLFSHFVNLQLCKQLCDFALWYQNTCKVPLAFQETDLQVFCKSLGISNVGTLEDILQEINMALAQLEISINYASDIGGSLYTPIGAPPRRLVKLLKSTPELKNKIFYFIFDEYENLNEYQQVILNTFIKQADVELTFKVGIRELGLKTKKTLNPNEQLVDPADYVLVDISGSLGDEFENFAKNVLLNRFEELRAAQKELFIPARVEELFEELSEDAEVQLLGGQRVIDTVKEEIMKKGLKKEIEAMNFFKPRELVLFQFLATSSKEGKDIYGVFKQALADPSGWANKVNNYSYASLFTIRNKKVGISKYYSGWKTLVALSAGNIRYLLQLVTNSMVEHTRSKLTFEQKISAQTQTEVSAKVGQKNLLELEGLSTRGAQLMKLVLGLGQVFHLMAIQPEGHAPEINQFEIGTRTTFDEALIENVNELIHSAVMHLALIRTSGTKLGTPGDTRDFDYMLHPIFAPFFVYSHRRKRKFTMSPEELLGIINSPSITIKTLLARQNRSLDTDTAEQLPLFGE